MSFVISLFEQNPLSLRSVGRPVILYRVVTVNSGWNFVSVT